MAAVLSPTSLLVLSVASGTGLPARAATPEVPTAKTLVSYDESWAVWVGEAPPPGWPLSAPPEPTTPALDLFPAAGSSSHPTSPTLSTPKTDPDRVLQLGGDSTGLRTEGQWWADLKAPYSVWTADAWSGYFKTWIRGRKIHRRRGKRYSRTAFVYPPLSADGTGVGPDTAYFVKSFEVDDPTAVVSVELASRYKAGVQLYLNGNPVANARVERTESGGLVGHIPEPPADWIENTVPGTERWEETWLDVNPSVLRSGTNVLAAVVRPDPKADKAATYFDATLRVHDTVDWSKVPYLHGVTQDAVTVSWETTAATRGTVLVESEDGSFRREWRTEDRQRHQEVRLEGLSKDTVYRYEVRSDPQGDLAPIAPFGATFRTAPDTSAEFSFLVYGDSRWGAKVHRALADLMVADAERYGIGLVVHTGDIVSVGYNWLLWQERFFAPAGPLLARVPLYPAPGNHEKNAQLYYDYFDLPHNEAWYHVRYGIADFYSVNSNVAFHPGSEQHTWLKDALAAGSGRWKIVMMHHPPFSCADARKPGARLVARDLVPLFEEYGVDLVLLGHDHVYGRSGNINGVHYLISGGGGSALYDSTTDDKMVRCDKRYNYVRLHVEDDQIRWSAYDETGDLIEDYAIE